MIHLISDKMHNLILRTFLFILFITIGAISIFAQRKLSGKITMEDGKPLAGAIINIYDGKKSIAFTTSKPNGD